MKRIIYNLLEYVTEEIKSGNKPVVAKKTAIIKAVKGIPGEKITSWVVGNNREAVIERETVIEVDENKNPAWVATKLNQDGTEMIDCNGHLNQWVIRNDVMSKKYVLKEGTKDQYVPVANPQKFLNVNEDIVINQESGSWEVRAGGYINITDPECMYCISKKDFDDTYSILEDDTKSKRESHFFSK